MSSVRFAREPLSEELWCEALPLLFAHWQEIAHYKDIPLAPDREVYARTDMAGLLRVYTARDDAALVGYAVYFVKAALHYSGSVQAVSDVIFLDRSMRGLNGWKFLKFVDQALTEEGVEVAYHHVKLAHNFGPILERMGYEAVETIFSRRLNTKTRPLAFRDVGNRAEQVLVSR